MRGVFARCRLGIFYFFFLATVTIQASDKNFVVHKKSGRQLKVELVDQGRKGVTIYNQVEDGREFKVNIPEPLRILELPSRADENFLLQGQLPFKVVKGLPQQAFFMVFNGRILLFDGQRFRIYRAEDNDGFLQKAKIEFVHSPPGVRNSYDLFTIKHEGIMVAAMFTETKEFLISIPEHLSDSLDRIQISKNGKPMIDGIPLELIGGHMGELKLPWLQSQAKIPKNALGIEAKGLQSPEPKRVNLAIPLAEQPSQFKDMLLDPRLDGLEIIDQNTRTEKSLRSYIRDTFEVITEFEERPNDYEAQKEALTRSLVSLRQARSGGVRVIGRPGTGKTYFAQTLISYIVNHEVPPIIRERVYIKLSSANIGASTGLVGHFETKIKALKMLASAVPVVLWIDEMHTLVGQGTHMGNHNDFFNYLKTELAEGKIKIIGTTTDQEWQRFFAGDRAMVERFSVAIQIDEPNSEVILKTVKNFVQSSYGEDAPSISEDIYKKIIEMAGRFDPIGANPRKSVDAIDFIVANAIVENINSVNLEHVTQMLSRKYGYDISALSPEKINERVLKLGEHLNQTLIGLEDAKRELTALTADHFLLQATKKSMLPTSFLLFGDRGTGKTTLARALADGLSFDFTRLMMSEFSTPGLAAEQFKTRLAQAIVANPYRVILPDELEKAPPEVQQVFLRILDEGKFEARLSIVHEGASYTEIDASKVIFAFTTNAARELANQKAGPDEVSRVAERDGINRYLLDRIPTSIALPNPGNPSLREILRKEWVETVEKDFEKIGKRINVNLDILVDHLLSLVGEGQSKFGFETTGPNRQNDPQQVSVRRLQREIGGIRKNLSYYFVTHPTASEAQVDVFIGGPNGTQVMIAPARAEVYGASCAALF